MREPCEQVWRILVQPMWAPMDFGLDHLIDETVGWESSVAGAILAAFVLVECIGLQAHGCSVSCVEQLRHNLPQHL